MISLFSLLFKDWKQCTESYASVDRSPPNTDEDMIIVLE